MLRTVGRGVQQRSTLCATVAGDGVSCLTGLGVEVAVYVGVEVRVVHARGPHAQNSGRSDETCT